MSDFSPKGNGPLQKGVPALPTHSFKKVTQQIIEVATNEETPVRPLQPIPQTGFQPLPESPCENLIESFSDFFEDFECSMEAEEEAEKEAKLHSSETPILTFVTKHHSQFPKISKEKSFVLKQFIDKLQNRNTNFKVYTCDLCSKHFNNHAALGGHKAKNHPHSSKSFLERKKTFELRKSERKKRDFLRNF